MHGPMHGHDACAKGLGKLIIRGVDPGANKKHTPSLPDVRPKVRIFLEGRYRKFVRDLPQTIFYCPKCKGRRKGCSYCKGFGKLTRDSVQELIARKILPRYRGKKGKFHGAGREDIDVRMLGSGRPFIFEVLGPKNLDVDIDELVLSINAYGKGRIEITSLLPVPRKRVAEIKETHCDKIYRALVEPLEEVNEAAVKELVGKTYQVVQRTPTRVVHRRADKEREREVEVLGAESGKQLILLLRCMHGTYVKEWISGEDGRSRPSLADLLASPMRCIALDVWDVLSPRGDFEDGRRPPVFDEELSWPLPRELSEDRWGLLAVEGREKAENTEEEAAGKENN